VIEMKLKLRTHIYAKVCSAGTGFGVYNDLINLPDNGQSVREVDLHDGYPDKEMGICGYSTGQVEKCSRKSVSRLVRGDA
jgi:hypothetical protein